MQSIRLVIALVAALAVVVFLIAGGGEWLMNHRAPTRDSASAAGPSVLVNNVSTHVDALSDQQLADATVDFAHRLAEREEEYHAATSADEARLRKLSLAASAKGRMTAADSKYYRDIVAYYRPEACRYRDELCRRLGIPPDRYAAKAVGTNAFLMETPTGETKGFKASVTSRFLFDGQIVGWDALAQTARYLGDLAKKLPGVAVSL